MLIVKNINPIVKATSEVTPPIDSVSIPDLIHDFFTILPLIPIKKKEIAVNTLEIINA